jgi:molybdopterin molybdotransferase
VAILSSGDELVEVGEQRGPGQIVNSNTPALGAVASACGAEPVLLPIAADNEAAIRASVEAAMGCDFIVSSGGVSVGDYDYVKKVLNDLGAEQILWRVAMKPGKPLFFCLLQDTPYFGLPGNPVSSLVSFLQFVRPAIRKASGYLEPDWSLPQSTARIEHDLVNDGERRNFLRARLRLTSAGQLTASTAHRAQGSHMMTSMLGANGFVVLDPEQAVSEGDPVTVQILGEVV